MYRSGAFRNVSFAAVPNDAPIAIARGPADNRVVVMNHLYRFEDIRLHSAVLVHEALHSDATFTGTGTGHEELIANTSDALVYAQFLTEDATLASGRTELTRRLNTKLMALVNTRDGAGRIRILEPEDNVYPGSVSPPLGGFAAAFPPGGPDQSTVGTPFLNQFLSTLAKRRVTGANFDPAATDILDRNVDNALPAGQWVRVAQALRLRT